MEDFREKTKYYDKEPQLLKKGPSKLKEHFQKGMTAFLVVAASILFFFSLLKFDAISAMIGKLFAVLSPIITGFAMAFLLNPIMKRVEMILRKGLEKTSLKKENMDKLCRGTGIAVSLIVAFAFVAALLNMLIPELYKSIKDLVLTLPTQIDAWLKSISAQGEADTTITKTIQNLIIQGTEALERWIQTDLLSQVEKVMGGVTAGVVTAFGMLTDLFVGVIVSIYLLFSKEKFMAQAKKISYAFLKPKKANTLIHIGRKANEIFSGFIIGKIIDSAIIGVLCFIGVSILRMPYPLLVSVVIGVTNFIPFFGPFIGAIPCSILILLVDPIKGVYFIIFILLLQQLDGNVIGPAILGDSTGLSPFWVIFAIIVGGGMFGVYGMILGVPTFALIYYIIKMLIGQKLDQKKLPVLTTEYTDVSYVDDEGKYMTSEKETKKEN